MGILTAKLESHIWSTLLKCASFFLNLYTAYFSVDILEQFIFQGQEKNYFLQHIYI